MHAAYIFLSLETKYYYCHTIAILELAVPSTFPTMFYSALSLKVKGTQN